MRWFTFDSRGDMVIALREAITVALINGILSKGRASWAVSGGSTPKPLFESMQNVSLDWARVQIALVDERWVAPDHPRSNEAFMKASLARGKSSKARFLGMKTPHKTPFDAEEAVNERYGTIVRPFDSIMLGMGLDAHTASLFPDAEGLEKALDPSQDQMCVALKAPKSSVTGDEVDRMSLSAHAIMTAGHVTMMITGEEKRQILEDSLAKGSNAPVGRLAQLKPFDVYYAP